jgi:hypothetical protein
LNDGKARERGLVLRSSGTKRCRDRRWPDPKCDAAVGELGSTSLRACFSNIATDICIQAYNCGCQEPQAGGAVAIGGAPPGDPYLLPSMLAAAALAADGWQAVNLGPDTPFDALLAAAERHEPGIAWLSISSIRDVREIEGGRRSRCDSTSVESR